MHTSFVGALEDKVSLIDTASVVVDMMQPAMVKGWYEGQYKVLFTMWETDTLPERIAELLPQFDQILVPCKHNQELFSQFHNNVTVVPLGVDESLWFTREKKPGKKPFRFVAGGSHWKRKGLDVVVEAFNKLQGDVELHLKCKLDIIGGVPELDNPRIHLHRDTMTEEEERDFYWSMNAFVSMARGEGWGLMPLQAIHAGLPTIISDTTGHKEFAQYAHNIIPTTPVECDKDIHYTAGSWDEPDVDILAMKMQKMIDEWSKVPVPEPTPYTWNYAAEQLLKAIPQGKPLTNPKWVLANNITVPVTALRKIDSHIGEHHIIMNKGETKEIPINPKNVLLENGAIVLA